MVLIIDSIREIDINIKPKYIFVLTSSITSIIGSDIHGICSEISHEVNAKIIPIDIGGLKDDYNRGVEKGLELIAKNIVKDNLEKTDTFNIIGSNIDCFNFLSDCEEIKRVMKAIFNKEVNTIFTAYTDIESLENASKANLNIVLREEGLKAAVYMENKFKIPYIYYKPIGFTQTMKWIDMIKEKTNYVINLDNIKEEEKLIKKHMFRVNMKIKLLKNKNIAIFADKDTLLSVKEFMKELNFNVHRAEIIHNYKVDDESVIVDSGELNILKYLENESLAMLLADGGTLKMKHKSNLDIQISNPNFKEVKVNPYNPFVGFRGTMYFMEKILSIKEF